MDKFVIREKKEVALELEPVNENESIVLEIDRDISQAELEAYFNHNKDNMEQKENEVSSLSEFESENEDGHPPRKRKRIYKQKFREEWREKFKWIQSKNEKAFCSICKKHISGSIVHLRRHENSMQHSSRQRAAHSTPLITSLLPKGVSLISNDVKRAELKIVMFLAEHNLPFLLMDHLPKFVASIGHDSNILKNVKCARTKATMTLKFFKNHFTSQISEIVQGQKFSIIADETTDISTKKCLALVIRFSDLTANEVKDCFLDMVEVEQCSAEAITNKIIETLKNYNLQTSDMIGFAADNASVMSGNLTGVQARLKQKINRNIFVIGCVCHSMALCASAASSKLPKQIEDFTRDLYSYFSHSSKRMSELKNFQEFINLKSKKILRPSQTRWLSLEQVVNRILLLWSSLIPFFTLAVVEDNLQAAATLLNALNNPVYKLYFLFLSYVLPLINQINLEFQSERPKLFNLNYKINFLFKKIAKNFMNTSYVDRCNDLRKIDPSNISEHLSLDKIYIGAKCQMYIESLTINHLELSGFRQKCLEYYIELCCQIKNRFTTFTENYKSFEILNPRLVLSGTQSIVPLLNQFEFLIKEEDIEEISNEFRSIPDLPVDIIEKLQSLDFEKFWFHILNTRNAADEVMFPHLSKFISAILCFPHSSATVERIFSQLNLIKTKTRNSLSVENCSSLLHCKALLKNDNCITWTPSDTLLKTKVSY